MCCMLLPVPRGCLYGCGPTKHRANVAAAFRSSHSTRQGAGAMRVYSACLMRLLSAVWGV